MVRYSLPWGELLVFGRGPVPEALRPTADALACLDSRLPLDDHFPLDDRFRPALLRVHRSAGDGAYVAVWPAGRQPPEVTGAAEPTPEDLKGVALAEIHPLACRVCQARFRAVYPDAGIPFFGPHLAAHRIVSGCPRCGADFASSRIQGLALLPSP